MGSQYKEWRQFCLSLETLSLDDEENSKKPRPAWKEETA